MAEGVAACGDVPILAPDFTPTDSDVCVAYGWANPATFQNYRARGRSFVYIDLGWWNRKPEGRPLEGFHKVCVNGREPDALMARHWPSDRFAHFGIVPAPWRRWGRDVVLAGMSGKSARTRGYGPQQWEIAAINELRRYTDRPIIYRPKPSWLEAKPIPGTIFSPPSQSIMEALENAWALVTLHSNAAVDALLAGVPISASEGVCKNLSTPLSEIESPRYPTGRDQLMCDIAYQQFNVPEMRAGIVWKHLKRAGVL